MVQLGHDRSFLIEGMDDKDFIFVLDDKKHMLFVFSVLLSGNVSLLSSRFHFQNDQGPIWNTFIRFNPDGDQFCFTKLQHAIRGDMIKL